jgi:hypothetical protein
LFVATASESRARANAVLPSQGSEDGSHLLHTFRKEELSSSPFTENRDYLPSAKVDWVVHVDFPPGVVLRKAAIGKTLGPDWLNKYDRPTVFGFSPEIQQWTFVNAGDAPDKYSHLQIAWKMCPLGFEVLLVHDPPPFYTQEQTKRMAGHTSYPAGAQGELIPVNPPCLACVRPFMNTGRNEGLPPLLTLVSQRQS